MVLESSSWGSLIVGRYEDDGKNETRGQKTGLLYSKQVKILARSNIPLDWL